MLVVGVLDCDVFATSSTFCFLRLGDVVLLVLTLLLMVGVVGSVLAVDHTVVAFDGAAAASAAPSWSFPVGPC